MTGILPDEWATRWRVRAARPGRGPRAIAWQPAPRDAGSAARGRRILAGEWALGGQVVEAPDVAPWDLDAPSATFAMQLHGQGWLDDLMAADGAGAGAWLLDWLRRFGDGRGPGWTPALTGRRLLRWVDHAPGILAGMTSGDRAAWFEAAYAQAGFLDRHAVEAPEGLPRMEALTGLLRATLALGGLEAMAARAADALAESAVQDVDADGGIAARNPEALLEVAILLGGALEALRDRGATGVPEALAAAQGRVVPTLRALQHGDGSLPRFHGGGRGRADRLTRLLDRSGIAGRNTSGIAMGFVPLSQGWTTVIVDAAPPPMGPVSGSAGASTLAFELTSGACPVVVNCGPGGAFGPDWHRAGRATASHSTLSVADHSSARIGPLLAVEGRRIAPLIRGPEDVQWQMGGPRSARALSLGHSGYVGRFGLTHLRRLVLSGEGGHLAGEDSLRCVSAADREAFAEAQPKAGRPGVPFEIRFHLHPDAVAKMDETLGTVSIRLPSGEVWSFRPGRGVAMALEPSVYLEPGRPAPRPASQVVLSDRVVKYAATVDWSLIRTETAAEVAQEAEPWGDDDDR